jgi:hypothetical protein
LVVHEEKEEEKEEGETEPTAMMVGREVAYLREEDTKSRRRSAF